MTDYTASYDYPIEWGHFYIALLGLLFASWNVWKEWQDVSYAWHTVDRRDTRLLRALEHLAAGIIIAFIQLASFWLAVTLLEVPPPPLPSTAPPAEFGLPTEMKEWFEVHNQRLIALIRVTVTVYCFVIAVSFALWMKSTWRMLMRMILARKPLYTGPDRRRRSSTGERA